MDAKSTKSADYSKFASPQPIGSPLEIELGGEVLHLFPERALFWPAAESLFVSDLHIGKEAAFRAAGLPVPDIFCTDLTRLARLLKDLDAKRLFILGDLLHDRSAHDTEVVREFSTWRSKNLTCEIRLIRGNHDRRAGDPPAEWSIHCSSEPARCGKLQLRHIPRFDDKVATIAGHLHPKHRLQHGPDLLRLPCFLRRGSTLVLPAFADFIDHAVVKREPSDSIYVIADQQVVGI